MQISPMMPSRVRAAIPEIQFGHGTHGGSDKKARRLKRWMLAELIGGTLLVFSTPFAEPVVANLLGSQPHSHVIVQETPDSQGDRFCLVHPEEANAQPVTTAAPVEKGHTEETHADEPCEVSPEAHADERHDGTAGKLGAGALLAGIFTLFHYGMHAISGGLFYKFGKHKAQEEMAGQGKDFEGARELLRDRLEDGDFELIENGPDEFVLRRKKKDEPSGL